MLKSFFTVSLLKKIHLISEHINTKCKIIPTFDKDVLVLKASAKLTSLPQQTQDYNELLGNNSIYIL